MSFDNCDKMDLFCRVFENRAHMEDFEPLMAEFFHSQVLTYLYQKNTQLLSAPEVDMICDLIEDAWNELSSFIRDSALGAISNFNGIIDCFKIDFPIVEQDPVYIGC